MKSKRLALFAALSVALGAVSCETMEESGTGASASSTGSARPEDGPPPEVRTKSNGDIDVVFQNGCVCTFDRYGTLKAGGRSCDDLDLHRARQAVRSYLAEQDPAGYNDV